jgi:hypothetical protein
MKISPLIYCDKDGNLTKDPDTEVWTSENGDIIDVVLNKNKFKAHLKGNWSRIYERLINRNY